jgi:dsDNA-binding SOS-regulon protein
LTSGLDSPWKVSAQSHPGMLDVADAAKVTIPMCVLGSEEEKAEDLEAFGDALKVEKHIERFADQLHGWMSARADLEDEKVRKEYERGYKTVLGFFEKHF